MPSFLWCNLVSDCSRPGLSVTMAFQLDGLQLGHVISYVIEPYLMSTFAAVSLQWNRTCWNRGSWQGVVVDSLGWKPLGTKAFQHHTLWKLARCVLVKPWMFRSASFLMNSAYKPWRLATPAVPLLHVHLYPSRIINCLPLFETRWCYHRGYWFLVGTPACLSNLNMQIFKPKAGLMPSWLFVGLADTNDVCEIAALLFDKEKYGILQRGPFPSESVQLAVYGCALQSGRVMFLKNACELRSIECRLQLNGRVISFRVREDCLELVVGSEAPIRTSFLEKTCKEDYYYPVIACQLRDNEGLHSLPDIRPCLCTKGAL